MGVIFEIINQSEEFIYVLFKHVVTCCLEPTQKLLRPMNMLRKIRQIDRVTCIFSKAKEILTVCTKG